MGDRPAEENLVDAEFSVMNMTIWKVKHCFQIGWHQHLFMQHQISETWGITFNLGDYNIEQFFFRRFIPRATIAQSVRNVSAQQTHGVLACGGGRWIEYARGEDPHIRMLRHLAMLRGFESCL